MDFVQGCLGETLGFGGSFVIQAEGLADDPFGDLAAADALSTDEDRPVGAVGGYMQPLEIRFELTLGDAGDFGPDAAQVLRLATDGDLIAHLRAFAANFANPSHDSLPSGVTPTNKMCVKNKDRQTRTDNHIVYQSGAGGQGAISTQNGRKFQQFAYNTRCSKLLSPVRSHPMATLDQFQGCLLGLALGDAFGAPHGGASSSDSSGG